MNPSNLDSIRRSFEIQAENFESRSLHFSKEDYLQFTLSCVAPDRTDTFLDVAAGTCVCGRSFSPLVQTVVCLDATVPMLQVGKREADNSRLDNLIFIKGCAEELPFLQNSFDIVFSRLAFHHFTDVNRVFSEMVRVLKPGGKLVMIDMEAAEEALRNTQDEIEALRDPSHVKNLSKSEMKQLFSEHRLSVERCETTEIQQHLTNWLHLTKTPDRIRDQILQRMQAEIAGKERTGFSPYWEGDGICFNQRWVLLLGKKKIQTAALL